MQNALVSVSNPEDPHWQKEPVEIYFAGGFHLAGGFIICRCIFVLPVGIPHLCLCIFVLPVEIVFAGG